MNDDVDAIVRKLASEKKGIVIWSAGQNTIRFLGALPEKVLGEDITIVDNDKELSGKKLGTYPIKHPSQVDFRGIGTVIITSKAFRKEIREQVEKELKYAGTIIDLQEEKLKGFGIYGWIKGINEFIKKNSFPPFVFNGEDALVLTETGVSLCVSQNENQNMLIDELLLGQGYEKNEVELVLRNLAEGGCFFDVGTNIGLFSLNVAKGFQKISVHSFEPVPETFALLEKNVKHNGVGGKVRLNQKALSRESGNVYITSTHDIGNHLEGMKKQGTVEVECLTMDSYVEKEGIRSLDLIKCDVEGAELLVLEGAKKTLERFKPRLLLEIVDAWTRRFSYGPKDILDFMKDIGYDSYFIGKEGALVPNPKWEFRVGNYFFIHKTDNRPRA